MLSKIKAVLFRESSDLSHGILMFSGAIIFFGIYIYYGVLGDSSTISGLFLAGAFALFGTAEFLPKKRQRMAGWLRIVGLLIPLLTIATVIIAPEMIIPR